MPYEYRHSRRVEFPDTDMAGIVHFSRFFIYMESAEHAFFRSLGFSVITSINGHKYGWPRLHADCQYKRPLRFEDEMEIHLLIREIKQKTIRYEFNFYKKNEPETLIAQGLLTVVCVTVDEKGQFKSTPIPEEIARHLEVAPDQVHIA